MSLPTFTDWEALKEWERAQVSFFEDACRIMPSVPVFAMLDIANEIIRVRIAHKHLERST